MCRTLGWTLRTYLYGGWSATSGSAIRLNRKFLTTSSDSALDGARSRVSTYRLTTMAIDTSKVARRRKDPGSRFILQGPLSSRLDLNLAVSRRLQRLPACDRYRRDGRADRLDDRQRGEQRRDECEIKEFGV